MNCLLYTIVHLLNIIISDKLKILDKKLPGSSNYHSLTAYDPRTNVNEKSTVDIRIYIDAEMPVFYSGKKALMYSIHV